MSRWRKLAALGVLVGGAALIVATFQAGEKQPVAIHVALPKGVKGLRLDVEREARVVEHLEWSYLAQSPLSQDASLELPPGEYSVALHAVGTGHDPAAIALHVAKGEPTRLDAAVE